MKNKMPNRPVHFEIHADDPKRAMKFYTDVFGWKFEQWNPPSPEATEGHSKTSIGW